MIRSRNKLESLSLIDELQLNKFPEKLFNSFNEKEILDFVKTYPAKYYAVRDKSKAGSKLHRLKVEPKDLVNYLKNSNYFTINVSSANYVENQLCVGEIIIDTDMNVSLIASNNPEYSIRADSYKHLRAHDT
ncbi:MAG: hypothetical protein K2K31_02475, partial [Clostridia bacterium]|nr:hypothetical protein [Clostridia bacterium]